MTDWFRSWHGAPTDPKWILIARKASTLPGVASAVAWALFDHASQSRQRGSIVAFDVEFYAAWAGFEEHVVAAVIEAMTTKGMIVNGSLANWSKRQPEREDGSAERSKAWRERNRTQSNAAQPQTNETDRPREDTEKNRTESIPPSAGETPRSVDPDAELFRRGREVLGNDAGGMITKLRKHFGGDIPQTLTTIEAAATKGTGARDYVGRVLANGSRAPPAGNGKRNQVFAAREAILERLSQNHQPADPDSA